MKRRIIMIIGSTETLEYFSLQMAEEYRRLGREVFLWDMLHPVDSIQRFENLEEKQESILLTFNFLGLNGEGQFRHGEESIWDIYGMEKYCIMVDSPIYYYRQFAMEIPDLHMICIDRNHMDYLAKWFPEIPVSGFLPLAGNYPMERLWANGAGRDSSGIRILPYDLKPLENRPIDVVFIGNYVPPKELEPSLAGADEEYKEFLREIVEYLLEHPSENMEDTLESFLKENFDEEERALFPEAMFHMIYVDLCVRNRFRGEVIRSLVDSGLKVYCCGKDWDKLPVAHPENLYHTGSEVTSSVCLDLLSKGKVSVNVMPWFKRGAHDRIFSSMLAGCVAVTDTSEYLEEILRDGENAVIYSLEDIEGLGNRIKDLLSDLEKAQKIADSGRRYAEENHTWAHRADQVLPWIH